VSVEKNVMLSPDCIINNKGIYKECMKNGESLIVEFDKVTVSLEKAYKQISEGKYKPMEWQMINKDQMPYEQHESRLRQEMLDVYKEKTRHNKNDKVKRREMFIAEMSLSHFTT